jgi:protein-arginine kinase activator protein McsA
MRKTFTKIEGVDYTGSCPLCIMDFEPGQKVILLSCHKNHVMHTACLKDIAKYYNKHNKTHICPTCRGPIEYKKIKEQVVELKEFLEEWSYDET